VPLPSRDASVTAIIPAERKPTRTDKRTSHGGCGHCLVALRNSTPRAHPREERATGNRASRAACRNRLDAAGVGCAEGEATSRIPRAALAPWRSSSGRIRSGAACCNEPPARRADGRQAHARRHPHHAGPSPHKLAAGRPCHGSMTSRAASPPHTHTHTHTVPAGSGRARPVTRPRDVQRRKQRERWMGA